MALMDVLGSWVSLRVVAIEPRGIALDTDLERAHGLPQDPPVYLSRDEAPEEVEPDQRLEVFIYLDSNDQPIATSTRPTLIGGEVAWLEVVDSTPIGHFVDWGLPKDLLVPFKEQIQPMALGQRYPIALYIDNTGRLAGTTKLSEFLIPGGDFRLGEWVEGIPWRREPEMGTFVILAGQFLALLPDSEPHALTPGEPTRFRIARILGDGKVQVSLRQPAHAAMVGDGGKLLALLGTPDAPKLGDHTPPSVIRNLLGISKKAFKRAAGQLLRLGKVRFDPHGNLLLHDGRPLMGDEKGSGDRAGTEGGKTTGRGAGRGTHGPPRQGRNRPPGRGSSPRGTEGKRSRAGSGRDGGSRPAVGRGSSRGRSASTAPPPDKERGGDARRNGSDGSPSRRENAAEDSLETRRGRREYVPTPSRAKKKA